MAGCGADLTAQPAISLSGACPPAPDLFFCRLLRLRPGDLMTSMRATLLATALIAAPLALAAQEPADSAWKAQVDLGLVNTAGNTSTTTLAAADEISYTTLPWTFTQTFAVVYGRNEGVKTAETYRAKLRADRTLSPRMTVFGRIGWDRDVFAGIERRFEEDLGFGYEAIAAERTTLKLEAGGFAAQQRATVDGENNFYGARAAATFKQMIGAKASFQQIAEFLPNLKDTEDLRIHSETALVAPLSRMFSLKVAYVVDFDNQPEPGFGETDRRLTTGLRVTF
jgi:putative salt-induced outer membrane protein